MVPTSDSDPDFTDEFCRFLQSCVANVDAAELLLLLSRDSARAWQVGELRVELAQLGALTEADIQRCVDALQYAGVVSRDADRRVRYTPTGAHVPHVATLGKLYVERPVTLFRVIYALRDLKITTFADAFKLRR